MAEKSRVNGTTIRDMSKRMYRLSESESDIADDTKIRAIDSKRMGNADGFQNLGYTPHNIFAGQPYTQDEVFVPNRAVTPKLTYGNVKRFRSGGYVTPEDVTLHELGHVYDNSKRGISALKLRHPYKEELAKEKNAERFKSRILNRQQPPEGYISTMSKLAKGRKK